MKSPILSKLKKVRLNKLIEYEESYTRQTKESQTLCALNIYRVWVIVFIEKPSLNQLIEYEESYTKQTKESQTQQLIIEYEESYSAN